MVPKIECKYPYLKLYLIEFGQLTVSYKNGWSLFLRRSCAATAAAFIQGKPKSELHGCCNVITSYYLGHSTTIQLRKSFTFCHLFHVGEGCCLF